VCGPHPPGGPDHDRLAAGAARVAAVGVDAGRDGPALTGGVGEGIADGTSLVGA
jgi:hypothetical protein